MSGPTFTVEASKAILTRIRTSSFKEWDESFARLTEHSFEIKLGKLREIWALEMMPQKRAEAACAAIRFTTSCPLFMATNPLERDHIVRGIQNICTAKSLPFYPELKDAVDDAMNMLKFYQSHPLWAFQDSSIRNASAWTFHAAYIRNWVSVDAVVKAEYDRTHKPAPWGATPRANATAYVRA